MNDPTETLRSARALLEGYRPPAPATQHAYAADVARLLSDSTAICARRTSDRYRAAWVWHWRHQIANVLAAGSADPSALALLRQAIKMLKRVPAGRSDAAANLHSGRRTLFRGSRGKASPQREGLAYIQCGDDWRDHMIAAADPFFRPALRLLALCGLRPTEFGRGVILLRQDDWLWVRIRGGKVTETNGQPTRTLTFSLDHRWARQLTVDLDLTAGAPASFRVDRRRLQRAVAKAADHAFANSAHRPSCLSFRHQFASDLKRAGFARVGIGAALGHASTRTQAAYGRAALSRGGELPVAVEASRPLRGPSGQSQPVDTLAFVTPSHLVSVPPAIADVHSPSHVKAHHGRAH